MKPGATARFSASISIAPVAAPASPISAMRSPAIATSAMTGSPPTLLTRWLVRGELPPSAPEEADGAALLACWRDGTLGPWLERLGLTARHHVETWLSDIEALAADDGGRDLALLPALMEIFAHVALLPAHGMLPPPDATADAIATGLHRVLGATGSERDANRALAQIFRFLGGRFVDEARYPIELPEFPAPEDRPGRWRWFTRAVIDAAEHTSYAPSATDFFHLSFAYCSSGCGTRKRWRKRRTESCSIVVVSSS